MVGQTISHYRILEKLGGGGMGVVYKAEDTKLGRTIALKVLPPERVADPNRKRRFIQEARAASALNHPNIITIYDIDEAEGVHFIAMEYVAGKTLERLITRHGLGLNEALKYAVQMAAALAKAHSAGIVHRDLKPTNVMVTDDGLVKVLDFGLAKLTEAVPTGEAETVATVGPTTEEGTIVGTVGYMSPEQAEGKPVDARSDIFSFGSVLYEMLTGERAFRGETRVSTIAAILREEPKPLSQVAEGLPRELERLVKRCLRKDPAQRFQHMDDLNVALMELKQESDSGELAEAAAVAPLYERRPWFAGHRPALHGGLAAIVVLAAAAVLAYWLTHRPLVPPSQPLQPTHRQITFVGDASFPAISPDGSFVAYVVKQEGSSEQQKVMVQDLAGGQPIEVSKGLTYVSSLRWSPDGSKLALSTGHGIFIVPRLGGEPRYYKSWMSALCWSPDGSRIAGTVTPTPKQLYFLDVVTGEEKSISLSGTFDWTMDVDWSPTGGHLLFLTIGGGKSTVWTIKPDGSDQKEAFSGDREILSPRWSANGEAIYYGLATEPPELWKIVLSAQTGKPLGPAVRLLAGLEVGPYFTVSRQGARLLCTRGPNYSNLWLATPSPEGKMATRALTSGTSSYGEAQISPDGKQIAISKRDPGTGRANLFVMPTEGGPQRQVTFSKADATSPAWSPDGSEIAFAQQGENGVKVWRVSSAGGVAQEFSGSDVSSDTRYVSWSPRPEILYQRPGNRNFHILDPTTKKETPLVKDDSVGWMFSACSSPDGERVAVWWNRKSTGPGPWIISLKDFSGTLLKKGESSTWPVAWSKDGKWVYAVTGFTNVQKILMIQVQGAGTKTLWTLPKDARFCSMTSDGQRIVYSVSEMKSDVWLIENFDRTF
jgi:serine/threonine protein kinase/Tol biopolymer transport system component